MTASQRSAVALVVLVGLTAVLALLPAPLPPWPPSLDRLRDGDPAATFVGLVRIVALAAGVHVLAVCVFVRVARARGRVGLARSVSRLLPVLVRGALGVPGGLVVLSATAAAGPGVPVSGEVGVPAAMGDPPSAASGPADGHEESAVIVRMSEPLLAPVEAPSPSVDEPAERIWTVEPGEHFWSIARAVVADESASAVDDGDVAPYWLLLVDANRDRLRVPDVPDLLWPGQVLVLPDVPPRQGV